MSDTLPVKRKPITQLTPEERAHIAVDIHRGYSRGEPYTQMARKHNITTDAVKTLLKEYAAYIRQARPDTRTLQEVAYREYIGRMQDIQEAPVGTYPALVVSTAMQGEMQGMVRLDKILGHETAGEMEGMADGVAGLIRRAHANGLFDRVNVDDLAGIGEEEYIEEAEIIE